MNSKSSTKLNQKVIYSKDSNLNSTGDSSVLGLFKTSSSLAKSIRRSSPSSEVTSPQMKETFPSHFASTAQMILDNKPTCQITTGKAHSKEVQIRNIVHDYANIVSNKNTYEVLNELKLTKRMNHLDAIDDFEVWKANYLKAIESRIHSKIDTLKMNLEATKNEIYSRFSMPNDELIPLVQDDINNIENLYNTIIQNRKNTIVQTREHVISLLQETNRTMDDYIRNLAKKLDDAGFALEEEIADIKVDKTKLKNDYLTEKKMSYNNILDQITTDEEKLVQDSHIDLMNFITRWKNIKLNYFIKELKTILQSTEFVDNNERYALVEKLKEDQMNVYNMRVKLIYDKLFALQINQITQKKIEGINKELEDISSIAEKLFFSHIEKLVQNSDFIANMSNEEVNKMKCQVLSVSYEFGNDNLNNHMYNTYDTVMNIDDLILIEITPILTQNKNDRTNYISKINTYIDEYDEYVHSISSKLIYIFSSIGKINDEHKKNLAEKEKMYILTIAKETDHDEDVIFEKEEIMKKIIEVMKNCINKTELDSGLEEAFKIMDELEVEYRGFFGIIEGLLNSHEGIMSDTFHTYEAKIMEIFGIFIFEKKEEILARRNTESEFLSKKKEAQIAFDEAKQAEEDLKAGKKVAKAPAKKQQVANLKLKKGELPPPLIPPRSIPEFKSLLGFDYLVDFTISQLIRHLLRNIIHNRDDDIFGFNKKNNPPQGIELAMANAQLINPNSNANSTDSKKESASLTKKTGGTGTKSKDKSGTPAQNALPNQTISTPASTGINFYEAFDPYNATSTKDFISPISNRGTKLLSEENAFTEDKLIMILENVFQTTTAHIKKSMTIIGDESKITDNQKREELLSELDIRLKSLAPRKGKIEVEEYDRRLNDIEKHVFKLNQHKNIILDRHSKDGEDNPKLLAEIENSYNELSQTFEKLNKGIEEEQTNKGIDDKYKKFKTSFYDFNALLAEIEIKLQTYSKVHPEALLNLNKNYLLSLQTVKKGGTYSDREIEFTQGEIKQLEETVILKDMKERSAANEAKLAQLKASANSFMEKMEKRYSLSNENIMAKDCAGKRFGAPKRLANENIINIKIKCNQAQEGLESLFNGLTDMVKGYSSSDCSLIQQNSIPVNIRKQLSAINNCLFHYGKYIDAFKPTLLQTYFIVRVSMKEANESCEITGKEELEEDDKRKIEELSNLGLLAKYYIEGTSNPKGKDKDKEPNFLTDVNSIDEKMKVECSKIYTGEFAKLINNPEKLPPSLVVFIQNVKNEMEMLRLKCVRELRTYCQNLYSFSLVIPQTIVDFIYSHSIQTKNTISDGIMQNFESSKHKSDASKSELNSYLGPYLANPYYEKNLMEIEAKDDTRHVDYMNSINTSQFSLIENEEKHSEDFTKRLLNNFESIVMLFDNFIFEEEFISLGNEEYFKERKNYNELLKLKSDISSMLAANQTNKNVKAASGDASNYNLDSKRTFKKIYKGVDRNKGKINYFEKFKPTVNAIVGNNEEKIKIIESEYKKENLTKNVIGLKMKNNKTFFLLRNEYYVNHCDRFSQAIESYLSIFEKYRQEEWEYKQRWNEMIKELKATLRKK